MPSDAVRTTDGEFGAALHAERDALVRFVQGLRVPAHDVEDVVQDALARAWRSREGFDPARPLGAWLRKTALHCWLDRRARARRDQATDSTDELVDPRRDDAGQRLDLASALASLPTLERELLLRFHRDGASLREISEERAMPLNTVKSHLHRARRRLAAFEVRR